jgi:Kdo2-lipid IVA lauroyltransferase/acyltransferase
MKLLIGWLARAVSFLLYISPRGVRQALAYFLAFLWFDLFRIRRDVALNNLKIAFPDWDDKKRLKVARESIRHLGLNFVEYSLFPFLSRRNYLDYFEFVDWEKYEQAHAKGKGVLMLTLHLGNGDMSLAGLALKGVPIVLVSKVFKLQWLNDLWFGMRERIGMRFIPPRNSSYALLRALKQNAIVGIPLDQFTGPPIGVRTTFFGKETGTAAGLSVMAERSGAVVLSMYTYRKPDGKHAIHVGREIDVRGDAETVTQAYNDELEKFVRLHPEQWMWIHKRWKRFVVQ